MPRESPNPQTYALTLLSHFQKLSNNKLELFSNCFQSNNIMAIMSFLEINFMKSFGKKLSINRPINHCFVSKWPSYVSISSKVAILFFVINVFVHDGPL